jgi:acetyl esterase
VPVDPEIAALLRVLAAEAPPGDVPPTRERQDFAARVAGLRSPEHLVPVASVQDVSVAGADGPLPARVYRPGGAGPLPTVVTFHGGGWTVGDLETHDGTARAIAGYAGAVVVSVAYRLAPEAPFPAAVDDALAATHWAGAHLSQLGGNDALAVAGDSAGGNLAAVVALALRTRLAGQLLVYPVTDRGGQHPSLVENATGFGFETSSLRASYEQYAGPVQDDWRLSPMLATKLAGVAPAVVVTAELDPLRDEGEAYAAKLRAAGVRVEHRRFDGLVHGFFEMSDASVAARTAVEQTCSLFGDLLHP